MKKLLIFIISFVTICTLTCCHQKKHEPVQLGGINADTTMIIDYNNLKSDYPDIVFYESQITLNQYVDSIDSLLVINVVNIFQNEDTVFTSTYSLIDDTVINHSLSKEKGYWLEDCSIEAIHEISLSNAINILYQTDCIKPHSVNVTFRQPLGPKILECPYFIFGNRGSDLTFINSKNGEVTSYLFVD
jgi:hypothetical protein